MVFVVQAGALKPLCDFLVVKETKIVTVILDAIMNILQVSWVGRKMAAGLNRLLYVVLR